MYKFDTKVQHLKYKVLRTVAKHAWEGDLAESILDIPKEIIPGKVPTMRCCVYKEGLFWPSASSLRPAATEKIRTLSRRSTLPVTTARLADMLSPTTAADVSHIAVRMHVPKAR